MKKIGIILLVMCMIWSFSSISAFAEVSVEETEPMEMTEMTEETEPTAMTEETEPVDLTEEVDLTEPTEEMEQTEPTSGTCGDNLTWNITQEGDKSILTISGSGPMYDYDYYAVDEGAPPYSRDVDTVIIDEGVTTIGQVAFFGFENLTSVSIPNSVYIIGPGAFSNDTSLESIVIPNGVSIIGDNSFADNPKLKEIVISDSVTTIGMQAFRGCTSLKDIVIPDSVTSINGGTFLECTGLESVTLSSGLTFIGDIFDGCTNLKSVTIPSGVTQISSTFIGCKNLTDVTIPDSVKYIGDYTFRGCSSLKSIEIPEGLESTWLGSNIFKDCTSLKSIELPYHIKRIGESAFENCTSLERVSAPGAYMLEEKAFFNCSSLKDIEIANVTGSSRSGIGGVWIYVYNNAFENCSSLESFTTSYGMDNIGSYAFRNCKNMRSIYITDTIKTVSLGAFRDCTGLTDVYYSGTESQWNAIQIKNYNEPLLNANIHFNTKFTPDKVTRIYGSDRYITAFGAADALKSALKINRFDAVVVAYGQNYADALSASALADVIQAPVLLVTQKQENNVMAYINANLKSGGKVYLIGGTGVIRTEFESVLKGKNYDVKRLAGKDRFATNEAILNEYFANSSDCEVLVCRGTGASGFADALSVSSLGKPILLVGNTLTASQKSYLGTLSEKKGEALKFTIIGGPGAVSDAVAYEVASYQKSGTPLRLAGSDRYATSAEIAKHYFMGGTERVVLVYGNNYPDGLSASSLAYKYNAPVLLAVNKYSALHHLYNAVQELDSRLCIVLGGPTYVSDDSCSYIMPN